MISCQGVQRLAASVRESADPRIIELIPGLQDVRKKTLPHMYFEDCSVFRGTYGRVNPLFQHPKDAVLLIWKPGGYDHVYFMFVPADRKPCS